MYAAQPGGAASREAYERMRDEILGQLKAALPVDGCLFNLHGAMVAHGYDDCEGDFLECVRALVGPKAIIGVELDPHCHLTKKRCTAADVIVLFKEYPHTDFAERLLHMTSKAYVEGEGKETFKRRPMGTGPYRFVEWQTNQRVVGEVFPSYWGAKPGFARVVWRILPDALTAKNALLAGEIDLYQFVPPEAIPEVQRNPKTRVVETLSARMLFMVINASEPPLDNKLVRQALNHAIDRKALVEQLYRGRAVALRAPMQETIPELNRNLAGYAYDPQKARDLLKQAGYQGQPIKVNTPTGRYTLDKELGEAVAGMLEKVGVTVEFKASEWGGYAQPLFQGKASGISLIGMGNTVFLPEWVFTLWLLPGGQGEAYTKGRPENWEGDVGRLSLMPRGNRERQALVERAAGRGPRLHALDPAREPEGHLRAERPRGVGAVSERSPQPQGRPAAQLGAPVASFLSPSRGG